MYLSYIKFSFKLNATGRRWEYEVANFQFSMNYKPDIQCNVVESTSRFPKSVQDLKECNKNSSVEEVRAIFDGHIYQTNGKQPWIPLVNHIIPDKKGEDQLLYDASDRIIALLSQDLVKTQKDESWIERLLEIANDKIKVDEIYKEIEEREAEVLIKDIDKPKIDEEDLMYRNFMYLELHVKVGHFGNGRTLVFRECFYWSKVIEKCKSPYKKALYLHQKLET